jgi:hypothetical protein
LTLTVIFLSLLPYIFSASVAVFPHAAAAKTINKINIKQKTFLIIVHLLSEALDAG